MTTPTTQRPNLLYIHTDQHTPYVTGCYGDPLVETPNLDRLAAAGVRFDNVYCAAPICVPARMAVLTGRHPYQNQVWTNSHVLDVGLPTLAHAMGAAGYRPVLIGRMHSVGSDQLHGYVERLVGDHGPNHIGGRAVDHGILKGTAGPYRVSLERSGPGQMAYQVHDEDVTVATVDYLNRLGVQRRAYGQIEPFSLAVGFMLPHPPYVARREDYDRYRAAMTLPHKPRAFDQERHPYLRAWRGYGGIEQVIEDEILRARSAYWGLVHRVDCLVGQILAALQANGLAENTLIIYTSDHGDMQGEHGLWWKHVFYEEAVKVPLIMCWPGQIPAGQRCTQLVSALDFNATLLDAVAAPPLLNSPGRSFLGLISDLRAKPVWQDLVFSELCADEYVPHSIDGGKTYQRMIRRAEWKLIYYHGLPPQLFNLGEDPGETLDRAADPACQTIRDELTALILADWSPDLIARTMAAKRADKQLLYAWAQQTQPPDQYRWALHPTMNYLEKQ